MRGKSRERVYLEKPDSWHCIFEGKEILESSVPIDFVWTLPLDGCIDHWGQSYFFPGNVSLKAEVNGSRSGFSVDLSISAAATVTCARCLSDAPLEISRDFRYFYRPLLLDSHGADESGKEDFVFVQNIEGKIDIADQVWESLIVSLPEKVLCSSDCRGLCPICGKDRNKEDCGCSGESVDPRFDILVGQGPLQIDRIPGKGGNQRGNSKE